jgi:hypothetical protein
MADKIEGYRVGDVSDDLRAWTERVAEILNTLITTDDIADDAVTYAKIQNAAALSVLGRAANSIGDLADIVAASNDLLLRRTSDTINFGALTIGMVANSLLTYAKLQDATGVSVLGRSANSAGVLADITAGANDRLLARTADALAFVQLTLGMVPDTLLTFAKLQDADAVSVLGRSANTAGVLDEIAASANDQILRRTGNALNFGGITIGMIADALITYAKLQDGGACSLLGRSTNSSGVLADISATTNDRLLARVSNALSFVQLTAGMVPNSLITLAMMADLAQSTIIGRASGAGNGVPTALTASQVLTILGFNLPVEVAPVTLSGTSTDLATGIPSWASHIFVSLNGASTNGTSNMIIQVGTAGGYVTTGYDGGCSRAVDAGAVSATANSNGFRVTDTNTAASITKGVLHLRLHDRTNNIWVASGVFGREAASYQAMGSIALSGALTQVRWTTAGGTESADAGTGAIKYLQ